VRDDVAGGQRLSIDEALRVARSWHAAGRVEEARRMCRTILATEPTHAGALTLLHAMG